MRQRKPNRLRGYDYSRAGAYFVTICVKDKSEVFGRIENGNVVLNEYGEIVNQQWLWLSNQYKYIELDQFIVMPNHFHGIICIVGNGRDRSLQECKIKPLPQLMGAFKTTTSKLIHESGLTHFQWQKSYHDHVIRNGKELQGIRRYIINNALQWEIDIENKKCIQNKDLKQYYNEIVLYSDTSSS